MNYWFHYWIFLNLLSRRVQLEHIYCTEQAPAIIESLPPVWEQAKPKSFPWIPMHTLCPTFLPGASRTVPISRCPKMWKQQRMRYGWGEGEQEQGESCCSSLEAGWQKWVSKMDISVLSPCRDLPGGHTWAGRCRGWAHITFLSWNTNLIWPSKGYFKRITDLYKQRTAKIFLILDWKCILKEKPSNAHFVQAVGSAKEWVNRIIPPRENMLYQYYSVFVSVFIAIIYYI